MSNQSIKHSPQSTARNHRTHTSTAHGFRWLRSRQYPDSASAPGSAPAQAPKKRATSAISVVLGAGGKLDSIALPHPFEVSRGSRNAITPRSSGRRMSRPAPWRMATWALGQEDLLERRRPRLSPGALRPPDRRAARKVLYPLSQETTPRRPRLYLP